MSRCLCINQIDFTAKNLNLFLTTCRIFCSLNFIICIVSRVTIIILRQIWARVGAVDLNLQALSIISLVSHFLSVWKFMQFGRTLIYRCILANLSRPKDVLVAFVLYSFIPIICFRRYLIHRKIELLLQCPKVRCKRTLHFGVVYLKLLQSLWIQSLRSFSNKW